MTEGAAVIVGRVAGSNMSAASVAVLAVLSSCEPPSARILPVGRMTASIWMRGPDIGFVKRQAGLGCDRSMISAVDVDGLSPPMIMTRARQLSAADSGSSTDEP